MKKFFLIVALVQLIVINSFANSVNIDSAKLVAINFFKSTDTNLPANTSLTALLKYTKTESDGSADFYIFDIQPVKGFVIVSAEDAAQPVIGYSLESDFQIDSKSSIGISDWMNNSANQINTARASGINADAQTARQWSDYKKGIIAPKFRGAVAPLLTTTWNQSTYYEALCPAGTYAGCVAIAQAQIMKYWNYPAKGTGSHSYSDAPYGTLSANFGATTYNWSNMPNSLSANNTDVATLVYQIGVAVEMQYGTTGSGASVYDWNHSWACAQDAYTGYFGYGFGYNASTIKCISPGTNCQPTCNPYMTWYPDNNQYISVLQNELNNSRPIQYQGGSGAAHSWVCDGYDANNNFHMNWGWGGYDNGYFSLSNLTNIGGYDFTGSQYALIGIQPGSVSSCSVPNNLSTGNITVNSATLNWTAVSGAAGYNVQYRQVGASTWSTGTSSNASFSATGLTSATNYEWQVQTICSVNSTSAFTTSSTFTTLSNITCSLPSGLNAASSSGTSATLSWASTGATNYNLQWKAASAGTWTTVAGITSASYNLAGLAACTGYQFQVQGNCSGTLSAYSSPFSFTTTGCNSSLPSYCTSTGGTTGEYIETISITSPAGTINNTSGNNRGYADFTSMNANIKGGTNITVNMTPGFTTGTLYKEYWTVYVDFNHNGSFTDAGEKVATGNSTSKVSKRFTVPTTALNGPTRIRIVMQRGSYQTNPCAAFSYGEVEDYTVNIINNPQASFPGDAQDEPVTTDENLLLYPNPASDNINVKLTSDNSGKIAINVYNLLGQKVINNEQPIAEGSNTINLNTATLIKGVYIFEVDNQGNIQRKKFIISR